MSESKSLIKNIFSLGIVQVANYVLPLISLPIVVRVIGPDSFGVVNYYTAFVAYFILLINYGFDYSGTRVIAADKDNVIKRNLHFTRILFAKGILFLLSAILFLLSINFISHSPMETKVAWFTFLVSLSYVITPNWFYQGMQELRRMALFNFISKLSFNVLIVVVITQKSYFIWQPLILSISQLLVSAISLSYAVKRFHIELVRVNLRSVLKLLWEDRMIFFSMLATNLYTDTNIVILGFYESKEHIGFFTAAWKLMFVFLVLLSLPTSQAMFPYIAESFSKNVTKGIEQIKRSLPLIIYASLLFSLVLYFSAGMIITLFYGKNFVATIVVFRILTLVPVLSFINTILGLQTMVNLKMDKAYFVIIFSGGVFSVIFNLIIIHYYGYIGCAWSWIVAESLIALTMNQYLKRKGFVLFTLKNFLPMAIVAELKHLASVLRKIKTPAT